MSNISSMILLLPHLLGDVEQHFRMLLHCAQLLFSIKLTNSHIMKVPYQSFSPFLAKYPTIHCTNSNSSAINSKITECQSHLKFTISPIVTTSSGIRKTADGCASTTCAGAFLKGQRLRQCRHMRFIRRDTCELIIFREFSDRSRQHRKLLSWSSVLRVNKPNVRIVLSYLLMDGIKPK